MNAKVGLVAEVIPGERHRLDPARIIETAENLARDVGEKLPGSSLAGLAAELAQIAHATDQRAARPQAHLLDPVRFRAGSRCESAGARVSPESYPHRPGSLARSPTCSRPPMRDSIC